MRAAAIAGLLFVLGTMASARAQAPNDIIRAADVDELVRIAMKLGPTTRTTDEHGDPLIRCRRDGLSWSIYFYGCTKGADCTSVQFSAAFRVNVKQSEKGMNLWNQDHRWSTAKLDDVGDPVLTMDVDMSHGVARGTIESAMSTWSSLLAEFAAFIGYRKRESP